MIENRISNQDFPPAVIFDRRSLISTSRTVYHNIHKFRVLQMNQGVDLRGLTDEQWGLKILDKCHHISTTSTSKDGPQSFRVRICKTCCQEETHIELGTYVDQESAILVNDTFEILNNRLNRLIVLKRQDKPYLNFLMAKKYDRSKGRDYGSILDLIEERISAIDDKKKLKYQQLRASNELISGHQFLNNLNYASTDSCSEDVSIAPYESETTSSCKSSTAWSKLDSDSCLVTNSIDNEPKESVAPWITQAEAVLVDKKDDPIDEHDTTAHEISMLTIDMSMLKNSYDNSELETLETILALKGLVTVSAEQLQHQQVNELSISPSSPPSSSIILEESDISVNEIDLEASFLTIEQTKKLPIQSGIDTLELSLVNNDILNLNPSQVQEQDHTSLSKSAMKRSQNCESFSPSAEISPRKRAATFSVNIPYPFLEADYMKDEECEEETSNGYSDLNRNTNNYHNQFHYNSKHCPIATLTWLASMEDDEVDVAKSLYELRGSSTSNNQQSFSMFNNIISNRDEFEPPNLANNINDHKLYSKNLINGKAGRPRSNSMPLLPKESSVLKELISNNTQGQRNKRDEHILSKKNNIGDIANKNQISLNSKAGFVGIYSPEQRKIRLQRFWDKRKCRMWTKKVKYDVRKNFADSRIRVKGRFVKKLEENSQEHQQQQQVDLSYVVSVNNESGELENEITTIEEGKVLSVSEDHVSKSVIFQVY